MFSAEIVLRYIIDAIFPVDCVLCGKSAWAMCPDCEERLSVSGAITVLPHRGQDIAYSVATSDHVSILRALSQLKDAGALELARPLGRILGVAVARLVGLVGDCVLVVTAPSASRAWRTRGYIPVARMLGAANIGIDSTLENVRRREDQRGLSASQRGRNLEGSIAADPALAGCVVILVDDVVTTGATSLECIRALNQVGARVAGVACLTRVPRKFTVSSQMSDKPNSRA